jgi:prostaglandin-endoperoxide synthase 2
MRKARLRSFNDYRKCYGLRPVRSFADLTDDTGLRRRLEQLYEGDIEKLEWYVGIFAEDYPEHSMMGGLLTTMVANDAFTQALSNPLLARNVFTEDTFTPTGMRIITGTHSLQQILERNSAVPGAVHASFDC